MHTLKHLSFEFYPPKTQEGLEKLVAVSQELAQFNPSFYSVTFGAGGSSRERTVATVSAIQRKGFEVAPHISGMSCVQEEVRELLALYQKTGITKLVVLRGDIPSGEAMMGGGGDFSHASDLVKFIQQEAGTHFQLFVAGYPEVHISAKNGNEDFYYFQEKIKLGVRGVFTQYFYVAEAYFDFVERAKRAKITTEIIPGIMPIYHGEQLLRFSKNCGADIPRWLRYRLESYQSDLPSLRTFGLDVVSDLCERLIKAGVSGLHFYTMNQAELTTNLLQKLGIKRNPL